MERIVLSLADTNLELSRSRPPCRTSSLTKWPGEPRESESVAEIGDLATILVNWLESVTLGRQA